MKKVFKILLSGFILIGAYSYSQWVSVTSGTSNFLSSVFVVNSGTAFTCGISGTVLRTTNAGLNWTSVTQPTSGTVNSLSFPSDGNGITGWAAANDGFYKTTNSGVNWTSQLSGGNYTAVWFINLNTGIVIRSSPSSQIQYTSNGGASFQDINFTTRTDLVGTDVAMLSTAIWYVLARKNTNDSSFVFKSTNGGSSFILTLPVVSIHNKLAFIDPNTGILAGNNGALRRTTDGGNNWTVINTGTSLSLFSSSFINSNTGYVVGSGGLILKSTNAGANWFSQTSGTTQSLFGVSGTSDESIVIACGSNGTILRTTN
ncbi:MAG: YCF48-related protein, partial [Ignavibacteria bacterium]|nr:YCF48-related protein [Ignavibacteria bacterium]